MQTRRKFLRDCSLVAVTATLAPVAALAQNPASRIGAQDWPGFEQFARQVNTSFVLRAGSKTVKLLLVEASIFSAATPDSEDAGNEKFSLLFRGPAQQPLEQDTYLFDHPRIGRLSIFIVPIGCLDTTHCYYEAIFDRPVNPSDLAAQLSLAPRRARKV
jgi:hypothetical protein